MHIFTTVHLINSIGNQCKTSFEIIIFLIRYYLTLLDALESMRFGIFIPNIISNKFYQNVKHDLRLDSLNYVFSIRVDLGPLKDR